MSAIKQRNWYGSLKFPIPVALLSTMAALHFKVESEVQVRVQVHGFIETLVSNNLSLMEPALVIIPKKTRKHRLFHSAAWTCLLWFSSQAVAAVPAPDSAPGSLTLRVRDSLTGIAVPPRSVSVTGAETVTLNMIGSEGRQLLAPGTQQIDVSAEGYRASHSRFEVEPGMDLPVTVLLDPLVRPAELEPAVVNAKRKPGHALFHGHIVQAADGMPLAGVQVRLPGSNLKAVTDARGYFFLSAPAPRVNAPPALPPTVQLLAQVPGYRDYAITDTFLADGLETHFLVEMERGSGQMGRSDLHKLAQDNTAGDLKKAASDQNDALMVEEIAAAQPSSFTPQVVTVPLDLRVGFNCTNRTNCSTVTVLSLEQYVRRGLNDEWIASWQGESLRSGAVAYRSYGASFRAAPASSRYDICSNTFCQVNDADTSASTDAATNATAGAVLSRDSNTIFRSEYSAENNSWDDPNDGLSCSNTDRSCGNGSVGSPAAGWPCLADSVAVGRGCFGHGRGMSQWGTQRWATQGRDWRWITNHYYNGNGNPSGLRSATIAQP
ncbi:MAG: SpoIID/LytB domain-containing protein [Luteimonas sp.]